MNRNGKSGKMHRWKSAVNASRYRKKPRTVKFENIKPNMHVSISWDSPETGKVAIEDLVCIKAENDTVYLLKHDSAFPVVPLDTCGDESFIVAIRITRQCKCKFWIDIQVMCPGGYHIFTNFMMSASTSLKDIEFYEVV